MNPHYNNHWTHKNHDPGAPVTARPECVNELIDLYKAEQQAQAIRQQAFITCKQIMGRGEGTNLQ